MSDCLFLSNFNMQYVFALILYLYIIIWQVAAQHIQEVWFAGKQERIYLQNSSFSGNLLLLWAKSTALSFAIVPGDIILWDTETNTSWHTWTYIGNLWLSLSDSNIRELSLSIHWEKIDSFSPDIWSILEAKKKWTTLTREWIHIEENKAESEIQILDPWWMLIKSIKPSDETWWGEFLELEATQQYSWLIEVSWLGQSSSSKSFEVSLLTWETIIITDTPENYATSIWLSSISLTDSWEQLQILWQEWQVIDSVVYPSSKKGSILTFSHLAWEDRYFWSSSWENNAVNKDTRIPHIWCWIWIQNKWVIFAWDWINIIGSNKWKNIQNGSSSTRCEWEWIPVWESTKCNPSSFILDKPWLYTIGLSVYYENTMCRTSTTLNIPPKPVYKYCEWNYIQEDPIKITNLSTISQDQLYEQKKDRVGSLEIVEILPNPKGSDGEYEWILLHNTWNIDIDVNWLIVNSWKRVKTMSWSVLASWKMNRFYGNLWLYNSEHCVSLDDSEWNVYDAVCYPSTNEDARYGKKREIIKEIEQHEVYEITSDLGNISIKEIPTNVDTLYTWAVTSWSLLASQEISIIDTIRKIGSILPNPLWKDWEYEMITIQFIWSWNIVPVDLRLQTWKRTIELGDTYKKQSDTTYIRTGNLWLYNSSRCVRLESRSWIIYDEFCYPTAKEWVVYSIKNKLEDLPNKEWMEHLSLDLRDGQICIQSKKQDILCKENPLHKYKSKWEKLAVKYEASKESSEKTLMSLKDSLQKEKVLSNINSQAIYDSISILKSDRPLVYDSSWIEAIYTSWRWLQNDQHITSILSDLSLRKEDMYEIHTWRIPLETIDIDTSIWWLLQETRSFMKNTKRNLIDQ